LWSLPKGFKTSPAEMKEIAGRYAQLVKELIATTPGAKPQDFIVSSQNEPNRTKLSPQQIVTLNTAIHDQLDATLDPEVRKQVKMIVGDLTFNDASDKWIKAVVGPLAGKVQGFSFHVYMHPGE